MRLCAIKAEPPACFGTLDDVFDHETLAIWARHVVRRGRAALPPGTATDTAQLEALLAKLIQRIMRLLTKAGCLIEEEGVVTLASTAPDPENLLNQKGSGCHGATLSICRLVLSTAKPNISQQVVGLRCAQHQPTAT